jgi:hypothetical protein
MATKRQALVKKLDEFFSLFIRMRASDESGYAECFTCGVTKRWREGDAGHFMGRGAMNTRWDETNVQFQCKKCNIFRNGEQYLFSVNLNKEYGEGTSDTLLRYSKQSRKYGVVELSELKESYKDKVEELRASKGLE